MSKRLGFGYEAGKKLAASFVVCFAGNVILIATALHLWGAVEVRADFGEVLFLTIVGATWLLLMTRFMAWLGVSFSDDLRDRGNIAALVSLCGTITAVALIYAGGSIGEGPSYTNNLFSVALGTVGLLALWVFLEIGGKVARSITEERDLATGIRMCGFLVANGVLLGRALAGNWHSMSATFNDFVHDGSPVIVLLLIAVAVERITQPSRQRPFPSWKRFGLVPALIYLGLASAWVCHLGVWEGMPK